MPEKDEIKAEIERLLQNVKDREAVAHALTFLFPKLENKMGFPTVQYVGPPRLTSLRQISNAEFTRNYFSLTPDEIFWGASEVEAIAAGNPQIAFESFYSRLDQVESRDAAKLRRVFLDILKSIAPQTERPLEWFMALIENYGRLVKLLPDEDVGLFGRQPDIQITNLLIDILRPLNEMDREKIISHAIANAYDISSLCHLFRSFVGDVVEGGARRQSNGTFGQNTEKLRSALVQRVAADAKSRRLYAQTSPKNILWFWWGAGHGSEVRQHTADAMNDPAIFPSLLEIPISIVLSSAGNYERVDRQSWSNIIDIEELHRRAQKIANDPRDPDADASRRFLAAFDRSDDDFL